VKSTFIVAGFVALAGAFGSAGLVVAAPASAACSPSFTSIPCTIAENVAQAPGDTVQGLVQAPINFAGQGCAGYKDDKGDPAGTSSCGVPGVFSQLAGQGCPPGEGDQNPGTCGLPAIPGNFATGLAVIATAPVVTGGALAAAPGTLAGSLANAPGSFIRAIQNGGTDPESE
jgi:hypothetical protein